MAERRSAFTMAGERVPAGRRRTFEIPVARLPAGAAISMPVAVYRGTSTGPTVWLSGAIHGDEINGVEIIQDVLERIDPKALRGTIVAVPIVNVFGFSIRSRYLPDRRDLNRLFPGSKRGSLGSRLARLFMETIVAPCDIGIDFHTGSDHRTNLPQIRADLDDAQTRAAALAFGTPVVLHSALRDGSLRQAAVERGKRVLLFEGGEPDRFDADVTRAGVEGTMRVLAHLGMVEGPKRRRRNPAVLRGSYWVRARRGGILRLAVEPGTEVDPRAAIGTISDPLGSRPTTVKARKGGVIIGMTQRPLVNQGDAVAHIGLREA